MNKRISKLSTLLAFDAALLAEPRNTEEASLLGILGVDEVGRGSLIGPVTAAAAIFHRPLTLEEAELLVLLDDSKAAHLNHEKRIALSEHLKACCYWGLGEASKIEVEQRNVSQASLLAAHRAILHLASQFPQVNLQNYLVVLDGKQRLRDLVCPQRAIVKADSQSAAVAAASVIAKAHRDSWVKTLAMDYPEYGWLSNAGYPTPEHKQAMARYGITPYHRNTYKAVRKAKQLLLGIPT